MKKVFLSLIFGLFFLTSCEQKKLETEQKLAGTPEFVDEHTARNSLDYVGIYKGILPCADCDGIETEIILQKDETYLKKTKYLGKSTTTEEELGDYTWMEDGNTISLEGVDTAPVLYFVAENKLIQLDEEGNEIKGSLAKNYELIKE